jgi:hypothetical protein
MENLEFMTSKKPLSFGEGFGGGQKRNLGKEKPIFVIKISNFTKLNRHLYLCKNLKNNILSKY